MIEIKNNKDKNIVKHNIGNIWNIKWNLKYILIKCGIEKEILICEY